MTSRKMTKSAPRTTTYNSPPSNQPPNQTSEYVPKSQVNLQQLSTFKFSVSTRNEYCNEQSIHSKQSSVDPKKSPVSSADPSSTDEQS